MFSGVAFNFSGNEYFVELLRRLRPGFKPPTRFDLSGRLLEKVYGEVKKKVDEKVKIANSLTVQTDAFSNIKKESIINFILNTPDPVYHSFVEPKTESQTGKYVHDQLSHVIDTVGPEKTLAAITDNASYCQLAWELIEEKYKDDKIQGYGCVSHILNLYCQDILKLGSCNSILEDVVKVNKSIKNNHILVAALTEIQESSPEGEKVTISLKLPGATRWGSARACLSSEYDNKMNLKKLAISKHSERLKGDVIKLILDDFFWVKVLKLIELLSPVVAWLNKLQGDESFISRVVDTFIDLQDNLDFQFSKPELSILNFTDCQTLQANLHNRKRMALTPMHYAANILDPSCRGGKLSAEEYKAGYDLIPDLSSKFGISEVIVTKELIEYCAESGYWESSSVKTGATLVKPSDWWKGACGRTALSKIAIPILNLPCSTAATERSFSIYGWIHSAKRNRFKAKRACKVAYIAQNLRLFNPNRKKKNYLAYETDEDEDEEEVVEMGEVELQTQEHELSLEPSLEIDSSEQVAAEKDIYADEDGNLIIRDDSMLNLFQS